MRAKVLKSDKYKRVVRDGTLSKKKLVVVPRVDYTLEDEELHIMLDSMSNSTTEEVERSLYEEIVEGFDALELTEEDKQLLAYLRKLDEMWLFYENLGFKVTYSLGDNS